MEGKKGRVNFQSNTSNATSWSSGPTQNVRSKIMDNVMPNSLDNVGTTTTNFASNKAVSWGVGDNNMAKNDNTPKIDVLFDEDLMGQVNATVTTETEVEVLDESGMLEPPKRAFEPIKQPMPKNKGNALVQQPEPMLTNDFEPNAMNSRILDEKELDKMKYSTGLIGDNLINNQPLSSGKLGVNTISSSTAARDVEKKGKFFSSGKLFDKNKNKKAEVAPVMVQKDLGLNDDLPVIDENELLKYFVRQDFTKLNMSIFSFMAFIFKGAFLINRKLYIVGLSLLVLEFYILISLPFTTSLIVYGAMSTIIGFVANPLYLMMSKAKVKSIHHKKKNRKKNQYDLNQVCAKAGGDNFIVAFLLEVLFLGTLVYSSMYQFPNSTLHVAYDMVLSYYESEQKPVYDGYVDRLAFDVEGNFEIEMPEDFSKEPGKIFKYVYSPNGKEEIKSCSISISIINKFNDVTDFLTQYKNYEKIDMDIKEYKKNGITWFNLIQEKKSFNKMLYAMQWNNSVLLLEYNMGFDVEENVCEEYFEEIFASMKEKEE